MSELAKKFHDTYEIFAPLFGYETRPDTRQFDPDSPNGKLMIAVCKEVAGYRIDELEAEIARQDDVIARLGDKRFMHNKPNSDYLKEFDARIQYARDNRSTSK